MSREAAIAEIDAELEKLGKEIDVEEKIEEAEEEEEIEEVEVEEVKEEPKEEPKEKPPVKLEIKTDLPDGTLAYKLREEARRREAAERELEELKKPKVDKESNYEGYIEQEIGMTKAEVQELKAWKEDQERKRQEQEAREGAFTELRAYEEEAAQAFPDYVDASNFAKMEIAKSIKRLEPNITQQAWAEKTILKYAQYAGIALSEKKHPGQAIYEMAKEWGYKQEEERPQITEKPENKISIPKLAENKKKSAGMSRTGGSGSAFPTMEAVASMSNAERMKLSESDWARLEAEG